eukprot:7300589-Alexandrium_andersonii.AAC.1
MAAGNRRSARRTTSSEGRAWVSALATDALGWERDLTEDGDVEARPGPAVQGGTAGYGVAPNCVADSPGPRGQHGGAGAEGT